MPQFLKEPLFHFALIGAALFALYAVVGESAEPDSAIAERRIVIDDRMVDRLTQGFEGVWRRPPTDAELDGLIQSHITEEVLVREALLLGLDVGDTVVRQRLRLKMDFLLEGGVSALSPSDDELAEYMAANPDRFARTAMVGFSQVYLGESASDADAAALVEALNAGADPSNVGETSLLPPRLPASPAQAIDGTFGVGVFDSLMATPTGVWFGPVQSGYGLHVVRVDERRETRMPELEAVRPAVERAWRADKAQEIRDARIGELRQGYKIERESGDDG